MIKILLVDDDPDILRIAVMTLSTANYETETASDALSALNALKKSHFDVLITDANMPQYSGYELVQEIRQDPQLKHLVIAMLTGRRRKEDIEKALELGANDYIIKPFDQALFLQKVDMLVQRQIPSQQPSHVQFKEAAINLPAKVEVDAHIETISEIGMTLKTKKPLREGQILHLKSTFFDNLNIPSPVCRVLSSEENGEDSYSKLILIGATDSTLQKIRAFIYKKSSRMVA